MPPKTKKPDLEWSVVATLAWFNMLGRPLTLPELQEMLIRGQGSEDEIKAALKALKSKVKKQGDYYHLAGVEVRQPDERSRSIYKYKWWRLGLAVSLLRHIPYVRMVAAANTLADSTAREESDIDVFIIVRHGRLFLTRFLITGALHLAGLRRHGDKVANRICLSFFATTSHRDFRSIMIQPYDLYMPMWIAGLEPVIDHKHTYQDFLDANAWVRETIPGFAPDQKPRKLSRFARMGEFFGDHTLGNDWERFLARRQLRRIESKPVNPDPDVNVIVDRDMLKFHEKDRRRQYREQWEETMRAAGYEPERLLQ